MKVGPFRLRVGVLEEKGQRVQFIQEHERRAILSNQHARCSFYVPLLASIVIVLQNDCCDGKDKGSEGGASSSEEQTTYSIRIMSGPVDFLDVFPGNKSSLRLYGPHWSTTGFHGKDVLLIANEETMEITIKDEKKDRTLATFDYIHMDPTKVPHQVSLDAFDLSGESTSFCAPGGNREQTNANPEEGALQESDGDVVITDFSPARTPSRSSPLGPFQSSTPSPSASRAARVKQRPADQDRTVKSESLLDSFMPQFKATIKNEAQSRPPTRSPKKLAVLPFQLRRDTEQKLVKIGEQLQRLRSQTEGLPGLLETKEVKAQVAYHKALAKAKADCNSLRAKNLELITSLEEEESEQRENLAWVQSMIAEKVEVIAISSDEDGSDGSDEETGNGMDDSTAV